MRDAGPPRVYLDWNATAPLAPGVAQAMALAYERGFANPASVHEPGRVARAYLDDCREAVARLVGRSARDVILGSGGTEANNQGLGRARGGTLVTSRLEHPSVVRAAEQLAREGTRVVFVPVGAAGQLEPDAARAALTAAPAGGPRMLAVQAVNHETGVLQPLGELAGVARAQGAALHVDAVQAVGRVAGELARDAALVLTSHKLGGPKGIGAYVGLPGQPPPPLLAGGSQERGLRPGTQSPALAAGFAFAATRAHEGGALRYAALASLRDELERGLVEVGRARGLSVERNGQGPRAAHVCNVSLGSLPSDELAAAFDLEGVAVSSGAACSAGTAEPSAVIEAMLGRARARSALRFSLGETTTAHDVALTLAAAARVLARF